MSDTEDIERNGKQLSVTIQRSYKSWIALTGRFVGGQGIISLLNIVVGFLVLRLLPISEYALYVVANLILATVSLGSDMGLSQGVNSIGARLMERPGKLASLYTSALIYKNRLLLSIVIPAVILGYLMMTGHDWPLASISVCMILFLLTGWIQLPLSLGKSILSIHHDADGLFVVGLSEAIMRLVSLPICLIWPTATAALLLNLIGTIIGRILIERQYKALLPGHMSADAEQSRQLRQFALPLAPSVIYFAFHGQISTVILSWYGYTRAIAEVGALSRLSQIVSLFIILCPFLIQPVFARIVERRQFTRQLQRVSIALIIFCSFFLLSAIKLPELWLVLLGRNYAGLVREVPVAMLGAMLSLIGAVIYTIVISRQYTGGQVWAAVVSLLGQVAYIILHGVHNTFDALVVNLFPAGGYALVQALLLVRVFNTWSGKDRIEPVGPNP